MRRFGTWLRQERLRKQLSQEALAEALGTSPRSIRRWEQDQAVPVVAMRLHLSHFFGLRPEDLFELEEEQELAPPLWNVPSLRNPFFTGREAILHTLQTRLSAKHPVALTQPSAVTGLGGIGKTQVAIEYAYRYRQDYTAIFWLHAETAESLMQSVQQIADLLQLPQRQQAEQAQMVRAVQRWLTTHPGWLLIGDNVEEWDLLQAFLPPLGQGVLLLTTRRQALGGFAQSLELPTMSEQEGSLLLLRRAKHLFPSPQATGPAPAEFANEPDENSQAAKALVTLLGGLPLALDQAGAYLEETGCSATDYLRRYQDQRPLVLARRGFHGGAHPPSVTTTLRLSLEHIERQHPAAPDLLRACAFLSPDAIPEDLLVAGAAHLGPHLQRALVDPYQFDLLLSALRNASLIARSPRTHSLTVHRLVQAVLQDQMEPMEVCLWRARIARVVTTHFPEPDFSSWPQCERWLPCVLVCLPWLETTKDNLPEACELLSRVGHYFLKRGRFEEAEPLLSRAVVLTEQSSGPEHAALIPRLLLQANVFNQQGKHERAESALCRTLVLCKLHLGLSHSKAAEALSSLGGTYYQQGRYEEAESLLCQALQIQEQQLGPAHLDVANTLNELALLYRDQERFEQAEELSQRTVNVRKQHFGMEHPETAYALSGLAIVYRRQGKYKEAEPLQQQALRIQNQYLGPEHPHTALAMNSLANVYRDQRKYEEAEPLLEQAWRILNQQLGSEHPTTAGALVSLATVYRDQRKYEEAESLYQQALPILSRQLGPDHPHTVRTLAHLAMLYWKQERYAQAEHLYLQVLSQQERILGPQHPEIAKMLHDLAVLQEVQGRPQEAASLYQRALVIRESASGPPHPQTSETCTRLQALLQRMDHPDEDRP
jgi:tetratricopeptide (TPR) repeat protein/transcriptional regulator with XRE-family HTH domain